MSRYLAAVLQRPVALCAIPRLPLADGVRLDRALSPERALVAVLKMMHSREGARVARGVDGIARRALRTLPRMHPAAVEAGDAKLSALHDAVAALPQPDRVPAILALGYALHERVTATGEAWDDCARALDAVHAHVGAPELGRFEAWARAQVDEVTA